MATYIPCFPDTVEIRTALEEMPLLELFSVYINWAHRLIPPRPRKVRVLPEFSDQIFLRDRGTRGSVAAAPAGCVEQRRTAELIARSRSQRYPCAGHSASRLQSCSESFDRRACPFYSNSPATLSLRPLAILVVRFCKSVALLFSVFLTPTQQAAAQPSEPLIYDFFDGPDPRGVRSDGTCEALGDGAAVEIVAGPDLPDLGVAELAGALDLRRLADVARRR
jgi:hypothetical protein